MVTEYGTFVQTKFIRICLRLDLILRKWSEHIYHCATQPSTLIYNFKKTSTITIQSHQQTFNLVFRFWKRKVVGKYV